MAQKVSHNDIETIHITKVFGQLDLTCVNTLMIISVPVTSELFGTVTTLVGQFSGMLPLVNLNSDK